MAAVTVSVMRLSTVILPVYRWPEAREVWLRAEELGFDTAYTYDHLSWREPFRDGVWFGAVPTLTAAAAVTERMRLGTLVTSPNFRHPVTLAKDLMTLDDVSGGRMTVGVGAGGEGFDADVLGRAKWSSKERADRFGEFVPLLDQLLRNGTTSSEGRFYSAHEARNIPGCVQRPRIPFTVAGNGPRGMRLAARYGQGWVTTGGRRAAGSTARECLEDVAAQVGSLEAACADAGREPKELHRVLLTGFTPDRPLASVDAFVEFAGRYAEAGIDEFVLHWPIPDTIFAADHALFERVATEGPRQLAG